MEDTHRTSVIEQRECLQWVYSVEKLENSAAPNSREEAMRLKISYHPLLHDGALPQVDGKQIFATNGLRVRVCRGLAYQCQERVAP
jgi:hypothetical protein